MELLPCLDATHPIPARSSPPSPNNLSRAFFHHASIPPSLHLSRSLRGFPLLRHFPHASPVLMHRGAPLCFPLPIEVAGQQDIAWPQQLWVALRSRSGVLPILYLPPQPVPPPRSRENRDNTSLRLHLRLVLLLPQELVGNTKIKSTERVPGVRTRGGRAERDRNRGTDS